MKRWSVALGVVLLACMLVFTKRSVSPDLLTDSDTRELITQIRARNQPLSWFSGDWPLHNHFYRPVATLSFEVDNKLYGDNAAGYGLTNVCLVIASILLLFWLLRELTDNPVLSAGSTLLFSCWTGGFLFQSLYWLLVVLGVGAFLGSLVPGRRIITGIFAFLTSCYAASEVLSFNITQKGIEALPGTMIGWLPGRTASVMCLFAFTAMASYARYERLSAERIPRLPSALDLPATKSSVQWTDPSKWVWMWALLAALSTLLAMASYEQAVMLPAALLGVAVSLRMQGYRVRFGWHVLFWCLLGGYLLLRKEVLPPGVSGYQKQQLRNGQSVLNAIFAYILPSAKPTIDFFRSISASTPFEVFSVLLVSAWQPLLFFGSNVVSYLRVGQRRLAFGLTGWALSVITFLPMAWVKPFEHYDFWPLAMRSLFVGTLVWVALDLSFSAVSRPELQAPARLDPAPGSLPSR